MMSGRVLPASLLKKTKFRFLVLDRLNLRFLQLRRRQLQMKFRLPSWNLTRRTTTIPSSIIQIDRIADEENEVLPDVEDDEPQLATFDPPSADSGVTKVTISKTFLEQTVTHKYYEVAKRFYGLPDRYEVTLPREGQTVLDCPPDHVAVHMHHFNFVLRFPLHYFVKKVLTAFNVCLVQVHPLAIRNIIA